MRRDTYPSNPVAYKLERLLKRILTRADPLEKLGYGTPNDAYTEAVDHLAERLMRREREPSVREAAFDIWGTLRDVYGNPQSYDEQTFLPLGEQIVRGWGTCFILIH